MKTRAVFALLLFAAGCSSEPPIDPATCRLVPGSRAIVVGRPENHAGFVAAYDADIKESRRLPLGSEVTVGRDDDPSGTIGRRVVVTPPGWDRSTELWRGDLRPAS